MQDMFNLDTFIADSNAHLKGFHILLDAYRI